LCREFEEELYRFTENTHAQVLSQIREKKALDDALRAQVQALLKEFKERFLAERKG
jgi:F-type H+-transporting ATPase subunit alpha